MLELLCTLILTFTMFNEKMHKNKHLGFSTILNAINFIEESSTKKFFKQKNRPEFNLVYQKRLFIFYIGGSLMRHS